MSRTTERRIQLLETVNATAVDNDDGKPSLPEPKHVNPKRLQDQA
jgi:hypothetical protein